MPFAKAALSLKWETGKENIRFGNDNLWRFFFPLPLPLCASSKSLIPTFQPVLGGMRGRGARVAPCWALNMLTQQTAVNRHQTMPQSPGIPWSRGSSSTGSTPEQGEQSPATHSVLLSSGMRREAGLLWKQEGWTGHSQGEALHGNQGERQGQG